MKKHFSIHVAYLAAAAVLWPAIAVGSTLFNLEGTYFPKKNVRIKQTYQIRVQGTRRIKNTYEDGTLVQSRILDGQTIRFIDFKRKTYYEFSGRDPIIDSDSAKPKFQVTPPASSDSNKKWKVLMTIAGRKIMEMLVAPATTWGITDAEGNVLKMAGLGYRIPKEKGEGMMSGIVAFRRTYDHDQTLLEETLVRVLRNQPDPSDSELAVPSGFKKVPRPKTMYGM